MKKLLQKNRIYNKKYSGNLELLAKEYIGKNSEYQIHIIKKKFGKGDLLIEFFYRTQMQHCKQGFLAYLDKIEFNNDPHKSMKEVEEFLIENNGVIDEEDFMEEAECDQCGLGNPCCDEHEKEFNEWYKDQFPKIDLYYGGVCYFGKVTLI